MMKTMSPTSASVRSAIARIWSSVRKRAADDLTISCVREERGPFSPLRAMDTRPCAPLDLTKSVSSSTWRRE